MKFIEELEELFNTWDLYEILQIDRDASEETINRSYKKLSLRYHPDKCRNNSEIEKNTRMFQAVSKIHKILCNPNKRHYFDENGLIDNDDVLCEDIVDTIEEWQEYWRALFPKITIDAIIHFENEYKNSEEERKDVVDSYIKYRGNMDLIMDSIMCATIEDEDRFRDILLEEIEQGNIRKFNRFINEPNVRRNKRRTKFLKEESEAKRYLKNKKESNNMLSTIIRCNQEKREKAFNSFLDNLMAKYGDEDNDDDSNEHNLSTSSSFSSINVGKKHNNKRSRRRLSKH